MDTGVDDADADGGGGGGGDGPATMAEVRAALRRAPVTQATVGRVVGRGRRPVGLVGSAAWRRRQRAHVAVGARVRRPRLWRRLWRGVGRGGSTFVNRWMLEWARSAAAVAEMMWSWAWGAVRRGWEAHTAWRRLGPSVDGEERVHGRPPD